MPAQKIKMEVEFPVKRLKNQFMGSGSSGSQVKPKQKLKFTTYIPKIA
jgi:hypothetical protein